MSEELKKEQADVPEQRVKGNSPDYLAYNVRQTNDGTGIFNKVGAAWWHRDGKGMEIDLDSMPVDGRVTLRELRKVQTEQYQQTDEGHVVVKREHAPQETKHERSR